MSDKFKKVNELPVVDKLEDGDYVVSVVSGKISNVKSSKIRDTIIKSYEATILPKSEYRITDFGGNGIFVATLKSSSASAMFFKSMWLNVLKPIGTGESIFMYPQAETRGVQFFGDGDTLEIKNNSDGKITVSVEILRTN